MELDHVNIAVPAELLDTVRDFYRDMLGLAAGERPPFDRHGYWLYGDSGACVHLVESDRHRRHETPGHLDHVAFRASGLERIRQRLEAAGVDYRVSRIPAIGLTQLFLHDPAGVRVELGFRDERE